ncbi:MAG: DUF488 domain-containing protein [bacterium]|nr:DUF488 domain-containing protein [bacterium]
MLYTAGHSNIPSQELIAILRAWTIEVVFDVRRYPSSRRHPHFNRPALAAALEAHGIRYLHEERLGGRRPPRDGSPHTALDDGFRGYADHMRTPAFEDALARLLDLARRNVTAVLCAEAAPERCHRSLLADALAVRGFEVAHILSADELRAHQLHPAARVVDGRLLYAAPGPRQMDLFESSA